VHVLTKVLVVFAAILSVALSALVIAYAVNTDRIAADYGNMQRMKLAAEASLASQLADANTTKVRQDAQIQELNRLLADSQAKVTSLEGERATVLADKAKAVAAAQEIQNKIADLSETAKTQAAIIANYRDEVTTLRTNELGYRKQQAELDDRINDLESQREVLEQNYRALQEQIAEAKRAQEAALTGRTASAENRPFVSPGPIINGRIEAVQVDPTTKKLIAKINVGTNDRVAKNMQFAVYRGNDFLGNLVVTEPDLRWSIGEVNTLGQPVQVREGDLIASRLQQ
jgi:chromosome segregation ATPase